MRDDEILTTIEDLVAEEHRLRSTGEGDDPERLEQLEEMLDQCWDLLRQRRAKREFGEDPDAARARSTSTVERYQQ